MARGRKKKSWTDAHPSRPSARLEAARILRAAEDGSSWVGDLAEESFRRLPFDARERRALTRLVAGVTRWRASLDAVLEGYGGRPASSLVPGLRAALRVAAFEILFSRGVPAYAAVSEGVAAARFLAGAGAARLANAVLRKLARGVRPLAPGDEAAGARDVLRDADGAGAALDRRVFPPPGREPDATAARCSLPPWLVGRWRSRFGADGAARIARESNRVPRVTLRVRAAPPEGLSWPEALRAQGVETLPGGEPDLRVVTEGSAPGSWPALAAGAVVVQDRTASAAVRALAPRPGDRVLDLCAAPGGKTVQAADAMGGRGVVVALDPDPARLALVAEAVARTGAQTVHLVRADGRRAPFAPGAFDAVLVDAPCSNTGVLRRRPEARWRLSPRAVGERAALQGALLAAARVLVRPGGALAYSTCSIEAEENQEAVEALLDASTGFALEREIVALPGADDGGYVAVLRRSGAPPAAASTRA